MRSIHTWSRSRFSVATTIHSFSWGGGQSEVPSIPSLTCRRSRSSCSNVMGQTSTTNGTRSPTDHSEQEDHAKLWNNQIKRNQYIHNHNINDNLLQDWDLDSQVNWILPWSACYIWNYLSWAAGDSNNVLGVEPWKSLRLLFIGEEGIKVLQLVVAAPAVHLSIISQGKAVCRSHSHIHDLLTWLWTEKVDALCVLW